jgi:hypothetical protein
LQELDDETNCPRVVMTYDSPKWDPGDTQLEETEDKLREQLGLCKDGYVSKNDSRQVAACTSQGSDQLFTTDVNNFCAVVMRSAILIGQTKGDSK